MTSQSDVLTTEQRTPSTITLNISKIRNEVNAICGRRIVILQKKWLLAAPSRSKSWLEREIQWLRDLRCKWGMKLDRMERRQSNRVSDPESLRGESQRSVPR